MAKGKVTQEPHFAGHTPSHYFTQLWKDYIDFKACNLKMTAVTKVNQRVDSVLILIVIDFISKGPQCQETEAILNQQHPVLGTEYCDNDGEVGKERHRRCRIQLLLTRPPEMSLRPNFRKQG